MDVTQVYLSRTNLLDILKDQGYNVSNYDHYNLSMIGSMMDNKRLDLQLTHYSGKQVFVKYHLDTKLVIPTVTCSLFDEVDGEPPGPHVVTCAKAAQEAGVVVVHQDVHSLEAKRLPATGIVINKLDHFKIAFFIKTFCKKSTLLGDIPTESVVILK